MKSKQNASHPKAGSTYYQPTLTYSFSDFKNSAVIDAEAVQLRALQNLSRPRPAAYTEMIIA